MSDCWPRCEICRYASHHDRRMRQKHNLCSTSNPSRLSWESTGLREKQGILNFTTQTKNNYDSSSRNKKKFV